MGFSLWTLLEASLLCLNAICILNEDRVLAKYGWSTVNREFEDIPTTKTQILSLMKSIRTVVKYPLIIFNLLIILVKSLTG
ncbi:immediate early response 3-interacting protein 1 [Melanaphis sacchari]|uniref:immediate early response 3-interacting protein 1 n=1 Tax=Melanaphis sacchari TaxID=742174 RepID=UPI000DC1450C|nr:immediate early response 3-interacting protein 1 [Melanaphis sacchari]